MFNSPRNNYSDINTFLKYDKEKNISEPFPNSQFNDFNISNNTCSNFISVISFEVDDEDNIFVLDEGSLECQAKLYKMKVNEKKVIENIAYNTNKFIIKEKIILNDFVIDKINNYAYIIYINKTLEEDKKQLLQIIGIDLNSKDVKLIEIKLDFDENYSVVNNFNQSFPVSYQNFYKKLVSISLSCDGGALFISPLASRKIYSISTKDIIEESKDIIINIFLNI